jgi:hypothetical protein
MNLIFVTIGSHRLTYRLHNTSLAASWVNHWYSIDPRTNTHRRFGPQRMDYKERFICLTTWIDQPSECQQTPVHSYQWPSFREQWESGDMVMGWHSSLPELRQLHALRDVESVRAGKIAVVDQITPEIKLLFGEDKTPQRVWNHDKRILWWLYENDLLAEIPHMGFEITCHADPIIARLIDPKPYQVLEMIKPGDQITEIKIYPPACF